MDASDIHRDDTLTYFFSPLKDPINIELRNEPDNSIDIFVAPSMEMVKLPAWKAKIVKKHIAEAVLNERGYKGTHEDAVKKIYEEMEVQL